MYFEHLEILSPSERSRPYPTPNENPRSDPADHQIALAVKFHSDPLHYISEI